MEGNDAALARMTEAAERALETGGENVREFVDELLKDIKVHGRNAIEQNFSMYAARFFAAVLFDRLEMVPRMAKFLTVCDAMMCEKNEASVLAEACLRNPRVLEDHRETAKTYIDQTVNMVAKHAQEIQNSAVGNIENAELVDAIRKELATCSRDELTEMIAAIRSVRARVSEDGMK